VYIVNFFFITLETKVYANTMLLLDVSSAMKKELSGMSKMALLTKVLKKELNISKKVDVLGLSLFGHRNLRDCQDVERVMASEDFNKKDFISKLNTLKPKGGSPLLYALKHTAKNMQYKEKNTSIILIASRNDSCHPDPCAMAKVLKSKSKNFRIHVISLDVNQKYDRQLSCIATVSDGQYFAIKNERDLGDALDEIFRIIKNSDSLREGIPINTELNTSIKIPIFLEEKKLSSSKKRYNLEISASEEIDGDKLALYGYIYAKYPKSSEEGQGLVWKIREEKREKSSFYTLEEGKYHLSIEHHTLVKTIDFELKEDKVTAVHFVLGKTAQVQVKLKYKISKIPLYGYIYARKKGKKFGTCIEQLHETSMNKPYLYRLPLGKYILILSYGNIEKELPFEIKANESSLVSLKLDRYRE